MVAMYFALGMASKTYGRADVARVFEAEHDRGLPGYVCPCVFEKVRMKVLGGPNASPNVEFEVRYYFWVFGFVWEAPFVRSQRDTVGGSRAFEDAFADASWTSYTY